MSGSASLGLEQAVLGHTLAFKQMVFPAQVYVGLDLAAPAAPPSESVAGTEVSGGGYARAPATFALIATPANIAANTAVIEYPMAASAWGTIGYFELWDAAVGGNRLYWGQLIDPATELTTTVTVGAGDILRFSPGALAVQAATSSGGTGTVGAYLPLGGGTLSGPLTLAADPTLVLHAATKQYVDAHSGTGGGGGYLPISGGSLTGPLTLVGDAAAALNPVTLQQLNAATALLLPVTGGTMTGSLTLAGNAVSNLQAVPLQQLSVVSVLDHGAKGDGTTNDTTAIQNTLNAYAGKAIILIPDTGHPYMVQPLVPPTGSDLIIHGTLKGILGATNNGILVIQNCSNVTVRGHGTIDGNDPGATQGNGAVAGIEVANATNITISGLTLQNAHNWNLNVVNSTRVSVDRVSMFGGHSSPEFAQGSTDCWITNSYINGPYMDGGFAFYGGVTNSGAVGNVFTNAYGYGCSVVSDPSQSNPCDGIVISNNVIFGNGDIGIGVLASGVGGAHSDITISDNVLYNNCQAPIAGPPPCDIFLASCWYSIVANNKMRLCKGAGAAGIMLSAATYGSNVGVTITGNSISDEGQGSATGVGIFINANSNEISISGNHIFDTQTTKTMQYGVAGTCGATTSIVGNHFGALINPPLSITPAADTVVANSRNAAALFSIPNGTLSTVAPMQWNNASGASRWFIGSDGSTESGGDTGSNFEFVASHDGGGQIGTPITINRANCHVTFLYAPLMSTLPGNYANDTAAAAGGVSVGGMYRNGSVLMVRVT